MSNPSQAGPSSNQAQQPPPDQSQQGGSSASGSARHAEEQARKDRTLTEFMLMLDEYEPMIPNEVTDFYLQRVGFECEDVRLKRLLSLAAQKFVSDIAADAYQHARIRTNAAPGGRGRGGGTSSARVKLSRNALVQLVADVHLITLQQDKTKTVLTMDDLTAALAEYGINSKKPEFFM